MVPKEIKDNTYAKFRGGNKVHYDLRENGEFEKVSPLKVLNRQRISRDLQWVVNHRAY